MRRMAVLSVGVANIDTNVRSMFMRGYGDVLWLADQNCMLAIADDGHRVKRQCIL